MNLEHLSKDKEERVQQLNLLIHNCNVYGVRNEIKQEYINCLNDKLPLHLLPDASLLIIII